MASGSMVDERAKAVGAKHPVDLKSFPQEQGGIIQKVIEELKRDGENPSEFYATIEPKDSVIIVHLWHTTGLIETGVQGNPGGKCRDFHFDIKQNGITEKLFWQ
ncbi:MAG: hypothetical protein JXB14_00150 [Candidatus Altiarchaeota archaeon]|nr:hypothetical protein [Candidatus Altiarchaeota archaeon]